MICIIVPNGLLFCCKFLRSSIFAYLFALLSYWLTMQFGLIAQKNNKKTQARTHLCNNLFVICIACAVVIYLLIFFFIPFLFRHLNVQCDHVASTMRWRRLKSKNDRRFNGKLKRTKTKFIQKIWREVTAVWLYATSSPRQRIHFWMIWNYHSYELHFSSRNHCWIFSQHLINAERSIVAN